MNKTGPVISFIIPAHNEQDDIEKTINSINMGELPCTYEIIVVDHNSTDKTSYIAEKLGAKVVRKHGGSIAAVRNYGAKSSEGDILVFLDADVSLTLDWFENIKNTMSLLKSDPLIVTGSHCRPPAGGNWIERYWFENYADERNSTNLGTGHMIVTRNLYDTIGGFNEKLSTGEDYEFCMRASVAGGRVINEPSLMAIHRGYPESLKGFIEREAWHGEGDTSSLSAMFGSKVAMTALLFAFLHIVLFTTILVSEIPKIFAVIAFALILILIMAGSWSKYKYCEMKVVLVNSIILYFYFIGRVLSFRAFLKQLKLKSGRTSWF